MAPQGRAAGINLTKTLQKIERNLGDIQKLFLLNLAQDIVDASPVDTGAYVKGHNIQTGVGSAGGQFTGPLTSGPKSTNPQGEKDQAMSKLRSQVEALPENLEIVSINNTVPHAYKVEYGGWATKGPYAVYSTTLNNAKIHLQDAINKVRGTQ